MKYIYLPIIFIFVFFVSSIVLMRAAFPIAERLRTMELDSTAEPPAHFPLLVKSSEIDSPYRVVYFKDLSPNDVTTTYIDKSAVQSINKQIGNKANTPNGKILGVN